VTKTCRAQQAAGDTLPNAQRLYSFQPKLNARRNAIENRARGSTPDDRLQYSRHALSIPSEGKSSRSQLDSVEQIRIAIFASPAINPSTRGVSFPVFLPSSPGSDLPLSARSPPRAGPSPHRSAFLRNRKKRRVDEANGVIGPAHASANLLDPVRV